MQKVLHSVKVSCTLLLRLVKVYYKYSFVQKSVRLGQRARVHIMLSDAGFTFVANQLLVLIITNQCCLHF